MDNLEASIEKLLNSRPVYSEPIPKDDVKGFMQKMGKKMVTEEEIRRNKALNDFGYNQNCLNIDIIRAFLEMQLYCKTLEKRIDETEADFRKAISAVNILKKELDNVRLRSTLNSNQIEKMDAGILKCSEKIENYTLSIAPGVRNEYVPKGCTETDISGAIGYFDKIDRAREVENTEELEKFCASAMSRSLSAMTAYDEVSIDFFGTDKTAAVLYTNLSKNSVYKINLLGERDVPAGYFGIICAPTVFVPKKLMLKSAIIVVTGDSPFEDIDQNEMKNLKFLNDCGLHTYITLDNKAHDALVSNGFRCVSRRSAKYLAGGDIVKLAERALESAVPNGAISLNSLKNSFENFGDYFLAFPEDIREYVAERRKVFQFQCLEAMEKAVCGSLKSSYFPTGIVSSCRLGTDAEAEGTFGFVDGMNYINHLTYENRRVVYQKAKKHLDPDGLFIMNGYDAVTGVKIRSIKGWNFFPNYEALWTRDQLLQELTDNGFKIKYIIPTGAGIFESLPPKYRKNPTEWIIAASL